jgi:hypothetical protein
MMMAALEKTGHAQGARRSAASSRAHGAGSGKKREIVNFVNFDSGRLVE